MAESVRFSKVYRMTFWISGGLPADLAIQREEEFYPLFPSSCRRPAADKKRDRFV
jgi:hypothetical protein